MTTSTHMKAEPTLPVRIRDELAWELVRDEWELLLAIGSGPTSIEEAAAALEVEEKSVSKRVTRLVEHGLIARVAGESESFQLVPAFYERREGMSSYLKDLVLRRIQSGSAQPLAGRAITRIPPELMPELIARAERELFPKVVELANQPESPRSERFSVFFAGAASFDGTASRDAFARDAAFRDKLLAVLRSAATARSLDPATRSAYLWVAEMRTDPEVATEIGELLERFVDDIAPSNPNHEGSLAFALIPASLHPRRASSTLQ